MNELVKEQVYKSIIKFLSSDECEKFLTKTIIDFLKYEDYGYFDIDNLLESMLGDESWQEIADAVGEDLLIVGNRVYTRSKFEEESKSFTPSFVIKAE